MNVLKEMQTHVFPDFSDQGVKRVVNSHPGFRRRLNEWNAVHLGSVLGLDHVDVARWQVALVADQHHGDLLGIFDPLDLKDMLKI